MLGMRCLALLLALAALMQATARAQGIDALGYYLPPFAYAYMQVLQQAVEQAQSLNDDKLADAAAVSF